MKCPVCREEMVIKKNGKSGSEFYGCSTYPECTNTEKIPASEFMRRAGVPCLPGFE